jgi:enoyl-CoA hydratase
MTETDSVLVERDGAVTIVSINRPRCRNAVDGATARKLFDAFRAFDADAEASIAVFTGSGGTFCAGADLKAVASGDPNKKREIGSHDSIAPMGPSRLRLTKPVIAAIEGFAVAGGMELALWADMRVVAEDATFGVFCRRFGVPLIDLGTIRLPRLIGGPLAVGNSDAGSVAPSFEFHKNYLVRDGCSRLPLEPWWRQTYAWPVDPSVSVRSSV